MDQSDRREVATLGGGCFWCLEAVLEQIEGVEKVQSGYAGGTKKSPSYEEVCTGTTGHAEVVQITFRPDVLSYENLLEVFFAMHDATTLNRQGADVGTQYRSVIFYHDEEQRRIAEKIMRAQESSRNAKIVTQVVPYGGFYKAEEYHEAYYRRNPGQPYCQIVISPKMSKLHKYFRNRLKVANPA
jgi:peptide-methionine (S)-S-oxide reductase